MTNLKMMESLNELKVEFLEQRLYIKSEFIKKLENLKII